jgi:hypothetical protein
LIWEALNLRNLTHPFGLLRPAFWKISTQNLPSVEHMLDIYNIPEEPTKPTRPNELDDDAEQPEIEEHNEETKYYKAQMATYKILKDAKKNKEVMLTWYLDEWLPTVVGIDWWGIKARCYNLPTDKFRKNRKTRECITKTTEGFGLLQFENSRQRWLETFKWKDANPKAKRPPQYSKKKTETHIFKSKWSDDNHGKGSGWAKEAYKIFMERVNHVREFREQEEQSGSPKMTYGRLLVKRANNVHDDETCAPSKRRKILENEDEDGEGGVVQCDMVFEEEE